MQNRSAIPLAVALTAAITGVAWAGPRLIPLALTSCKTATACLVATNGSTGPAILGSTTLGTGVLGTTSGTTKAAGVYGSAASSGTGIAGTSSSGDGLEGLSTKTVGISATSNGANPALSGTASVGATSAGVKGVAANGTGIVSEGQAAFTGVGQFTITATASTTTLFELMSAAVVSHGKGYIKLPPAAVFSVDKAGNVSFEGMTVDCPAYTTVGACRATAAAPVGAAVSERATRVATTGSLLVHVVRFGQARLIGGSARVALDPALASGLTGSRAYHVLLSDAGATASWLYVADKSAAAFVVREHGAGRSSGTFGYRIMADVRPPVSTTSSAKGVF